MTDVWGQALRVIGTQVSSQIFETWFMPTSCVSVNNNKIVVEVPADSFKDVLSSRYGQLIENVIYEMMNREMSITFQVNPRMLEEGSAEKAVGPEKQIEEVGLGEYSGKYLNNRYTFDSFVVGGSNEFAHAAASAVAERPAKAYNPLFIYGGVGLGKTHLMHAIGHKVLSKFPSLNLLYVSSEAFMNEVIWGIRNDKMTSFRRKYRHIDVLLIDDVQFIAGKESTQSEFFHTFNALYEAHKQIVISSDQFPKDISDIEERLRSRFEWGLIADIQPPSLETKVAILQKKAHLEGIKLPRDVSLFIAQKIKSNIRELEGSLIRLGAYASLSNQTITKEFARDVLKDIIHEDEKIVNIDSILKATASFFSIKVSAMKSKTRDRSISYPRQIAMYLARELTELSLPALGRKFGGKDHTTILYACRKIEKQMQKDLNTRKKVENLKRIICE